MTYVIFIVVNDAQQNAHSHRILVTACIYNNIYWQYDLVGYNSK